MGVLGRVERLTSCKEEPVTGKGCPPQPSTILKVPTQCPARDSVSVCRTTPLPRAQGVSRAQEAQRSQDEVFALQGFSRGRGVCVCDRFSPSATGPLELGYRNGRKGHREEAAGAEEAPGAQAPGADAGS